MKVGFDGLLNSDFWRCFDEDVLCLVSELLLNDVLMIIDVFEEV